MGRGGSIAFGAGAGPLLPPPGNARAGLAFPKPGGGEVGDSGRAPSPELPARGAGLPRAGGSAPAARCVLPPGPGRVRRGRGIPPRLVQFHQVQMSR